MCRWPMHSRRLFFDPQENYKHQITFFAQEIYEALYKELSNREFVCQLMKHSDSIRRTGWTQP